MDRACRVKPSDRGRRPIPAEPGHPLDDLVAADGVQRARAGLTGQGLDLGQAGAEGERHVVAGVAVGDREHVEVVDLLAPGFQMGQRALHDGAEAEEAGLRGRRGHEGRDAAYTALVTLPAFRQRVQT